MESRRLLAAVANKVADINQASIMLDPQSFTPVPTLGATFFTAKSYHGDGRELWRTDGTAAGTRRVKDIAPGSFASDPSNLLDFNGTIYFTANDGTSGVELWKSDGTDAGTVRVRDIRAGATGANPRFLTRAGNRLFFVANDGTGDSIWTTDGTDAGTGRPMPNTTYTFGTSMPLAGTSSDLYFGATQVGAVTFSGTALFKLRADLSAGATPLRSFYGAPSELAVVGNRVFFNGVTNSGSGGDLYMSDGTSGGTQQIYDVGASYVSVRRITAAGLYTYFLAYDPTIGYATLYRTDGNFGTAAVSSSLLKIDRSASLTPLPGTNSILFPATTTSSGTELYRSDGTSGSTTLVKDVLAGADSGSSGAPIFVNNVGYLVGQRVDGATDLWRTDGTAAGTTLVRDFGGQFLWWVGPGVEGVLFGVTYAGGVGELWKSNGTAANTLRVGTSNAIGNGSSMFDYWTRINSGRAFTNWGASVLFAADDGLNGQELWVSNPTTGTRMLADINVGVGSSNPNGFAVASDGSVLFQAKTPATGAELYRLLPSGAVQLAANVDPGIAGSAPSYLRSYGASVYYLGHSSADSSGYLYRYDVSTLTNSLVRDAANLRLLPSTPLMIVNGTAYFCATTETNRSVSGLYVMASAGATPVRLRTLNVSGDNLTTAFASIGSTLYVVASDGTTGDELWKTDGTIAGTTLVKDANPGAGDAGGEELFAFNGKLYFAATSSSNLDQTLWVSDGTAAGTASLGASVKNPYAFTVVGSYLTFIATGSNGANNLFRTNGTGPVEPVLSGVSATLAPVSTYASGNWLFYVMQETSGSTRKLSLYRYTPLAGTTPTQFVKDLWAPTPADVTLNSTWAVGRLAFTAQGNRLYFPAYRTEWGVEPFSFLIDPIATSVSGDVYWDRDNNGTKDANETVAVGVSVYVDLDNDAFQDADEPTALVNANGGYTFSGLDYGTYIVRPVLNAGWSQSQPTGNAGASLTITAAAASASGGRVGLFDAVAPTLTALAFDRDAARMQIRFSFDDAVDPATLHVSDVGLIADGQPLPVPLGNRQLTYDAATRTATLSFPGYANGILPEGRYHATLGAGVAADAFGNVSTGARQVDFSVMPGDVNGDASVNFDDLLAVAQNYGQSARVWSQGDFNYDGTVNFDDLLVLAQRYGQPLPALTLTPAKQQQPASARVAQGVLDTRR